MPFFTTNVINTSADRFLSPIFLGDTIYNVSGSTITFSNAGATGRVGPSLTQCRSSYSNQPGFAIWGNNTRLFWVDLGVQYWRVPKNGVYEITAAGAGGAITNPGRGAIVRQSFELRAWDILRIIVGQTGVSGGGNRGGGGGASCISRIFPHSGAQQLLLIGGGGAGTSDNNATLGDQPKRDGIVTTPSEVPVGGTGSVITASYGSPSISQYWGGGGGGGWADSGDRGGAGWARYPSMVNNQGNSLSAPCPFGGFSESGSFGGFGGGGGTGRDSGAAGGGGGWRGGNGQNSTNTGGGSNYEDSNRGGESYGLNGFTVIGSGASGRISHGYVTILCA